MDSIRTIPIVFTTSIKKSFARFIKKRSTDATPIPTTTATVAATRWNTWTFRSGTARRHTTRSLWNFIKPGRVSVPYWRTRGPINGTSGKRNNGGSDGPWKKTIYGVGERPARYGMMKLPPWFDSWNDAIRESWPKRKKWNTHGYYENTNWRNWPNNANWKRNWPIELGANRPNKRPWPWKKTTGSMDGYDWPIYKTRIMITTAAAVARKRNGAKVVKRFVTTTRRNRKPSTPSSHHHWTRKIHPFQSRKWISWI